MLNAGSRVLFPKTLIFSSLETFALQRKQTLEVEIFFGVLLALIANKIIAGSRVTCVRKCHILSVNCTDQQQNKSFDITEINLLLSFADGFSLVHETRTEKLDAFASYHLSSPCDPFFNFVAMQSNFYRLRLVFVLGFLLRLRKA